jgi:hypothetical protein
VLAEIGTDLARFKSVKHFCSWIGLCPGVVSHTELQFTGSILPECVTAS